MRIAIDKRARAALKAGVISALKQTYVSRSGFVDFHSTHALGALDKTLTSAAVKELAGYIGEEPVSEFIYRKLATKVTEHYGFDFQKDRTPLIEKPEFSDVDSLSEEWISELESLPWSYKLQIPLSKPTGDFLVKAFAGDDLGFGIAICEKEPLTNPENADGEFRKKGLARRVLGDPPDWSGAARTYVELYAEGFIGDWGISESLRRGLNQLEGFLGLLVASRLIRVNPIYARAKGPINVDLYRRIGEEWHLQRRPELPESIALVINSIEPVSRNQSQFLSGESDLVPKVVQMVSKVLRSQEKATRIFTAAKWLLNSYTTADEMLAFLQATIVLEILLGDEKPNEKIGVSELLRNRCVYLVSEKVADREEIKKMFDQIYTVRSRIVHTGKHQLSRHDRSLLTQLRWLAAKVVTKEAQLLSAEL